MLLLNKKKVTAKELAEHFNVSVRTIQRDIDSLTLAGVPLYADVGKNGGYQLLEHYKMDKNFLNIGESKVLIAFLENLQQSTPNQEVKSLYNKFQTILPEVTEQQKLVVQLNPLMQSKNMQNCIERITVGQDQSRIMAIEYMDAEFQRSFRRVHPYTLVMLGSAWYVYGYCEMREAFRLFKLSRVASCELTDEHFEQQPLPSPPPWEEGPSGGREGTPVILEVDKVLQGKLPDYFEYDNCEILEDKIIVHLNFPVDEWFYSLLMSLVPYVKIVEPLWLKQDFVNRLKKSLESNKYDTLTL